MRLTTKQRRTALLLKVLNRLVRTEGIGGPHWTFREWDGVEEDEFKELLALAIGFEKAAKMYKTLAKQY